MKRGRHGQLQRMRQSLDVRRDPPSANEPQQGIGDLLLRQQRRGWQVFLWCLGSQYLSLVEAHVAYTCIQDTRSAYKCTKTAQQALKPHPTVKCLHFNYSGTRLKRTPLGPGFLSVIVVNQAPQKLARLNSPTGYNFIPTRTPSLLTDLYIYT